MWGIDRLTYGELSNTRRRVRNSSVVLLSQQAAVDQRGQPCLEALRQMGAHPIRVFGPEHGYDGVAQAEEPVDGGAGTAGVDERRSACPTAEAISEEARPTEFVSLYGRKRETLSPQPHQFEGADLLVIDLLDVGSRYYTYVWSALLCARAAEAQGVHTLVLDRPNPLSGSPDCLEGAPQEPGFTSLVGLEPLPVRHSLTLGELLVHFFSEAGKPLGPNGALSVVSCQGWERLNTARAWRRPFVAPSPNMPSLETALVYPGGCLLEGTNLSEGRGTTQPFQVVGAPFLDGEELARTLRAAPLEGLMVRPHAFRPTFGKHQGSICRGVSLHVTDPVRFRPYATYLTLIAQAQAQAPEAFEFLNRVYEFETEHPAMDLLTGSAQARQALLTGATAQELVSQLAPVDARWREVVRSAQSLANQAAA